MGSCCVTSPQTRNEEEARRTPPTGSADDHLERREGSRSPGVSHSHHDPLLHGRAPQLPLAKAFGVTRSQRSSSRGDSIRFAQSANSDVAPCQRSVSTFLKNTFSLNPKGRAEAIRPQAR